MSIYNKVLKRIEDLIAEGNRLHRLNITERKSSGHGWIWNAEFQIAFFSWIQSSVNVIDILVGKDNYYYASFPKEPNSSDMPHIRYTTAMCIAILTSLKNEIENGFINRIENLISADIIETISDHATVLLEAGFKDGAAIYCRVMIETSLKKICDSNSIDYPVKSTIGPLLLILKNKRILNLLEWRRVSAWADIGNAAAHGRFDEYSLEDVQIMMQGIKTFTSTKLT